MDKKTIIQFSWLLGLLAFITIVAIITRPTEINRLEFIEKRLDNIALQKEILTDREKQLEQLATEKDWEEVDNDNNK